MIMSSLAMHQLITLYETRTHQIRPLTDTTDPDLGEGAPPTTVQRGDPAINPAFEPLDDEGI